MSAGRLFESRGPAVANDRSPTVTHHNVLLFVADAEAATLALTGLTISG